MLKIERDQKTKTTPSDVTRFESSDVVRNIVKSIGVLVDGAGHVNITRSLFADIRDLIITETFIDNTHRSGVIANMTMNEYSSMETTDGQYCITVFKHKRSEAGPIRVILDDKLYGWLKLYVEKVRCVATSDMASQALVFVTWSGKKFGSSGNVSTASCSLWRRSGIQGTCDANKFRKAVVSANHSSTSDKQLNKDVANLMGHSELTVEQYYYMEEKLQFAQTAAKCVPAVMRSYDEVGKERQRFSVEGRNC